MCLLFVDPRVWTSELGSNFVHENYSRMSPAPPPPVHALRHQLPSGPPASLMAACNWEQFSHPDPVLSCLWKTSYEEPNVTEARLPKYHLRRPVARRPCHRALLGGAGGTGKACCQDKAGQRVHSRVPPPRPFLLRDSEDGSGLLVVGDRQSGCM